MFINRKVNLFLAILLFPLLCSCGISGYGAQYSEIRKPIYHYVKNGDSVYTISKRYKIEPDSILLINDINDYRNLQTGQKLLVGYRYSNSETVSEKLKSKNNSPGKIIVKPRTEDKGNGELSWPVSVGEIVSEFGPRNGSFHDGIDISCPTGTPVYASHSGVIVYAGDRLSGYGNLVVLRHNTGFTTVYAHNSRIFVSDGETVKKGQYIAQVGATGHATGPHLHYEIRVKDNLGRYVAVDPMPILNGQSQPKVKYRVNESLTGLIARIFN